MFRDTFGEDTFCLKSPPKMWEWEWEWLFGVQALLCQWGDGSKIDITQTIKLEDIDMLRVNLYSATAIVLIFDISTDGFNWKQAVDKILEIRKATW